MESSLELARKRFYETQKRTRWDVPEDKITQKRGRKPKPSKWVRTVNKFCPHEQARR